MILSPRGLREVLAVESDRSAANQSTGGQLANQALLAAREAVSRYYDAELRSDDELAPVRTRDISLACAFVHVTPHAEAKSRRTSIWVLAMRPRLPIA